MPTAIPKFEIRPIKVYYLKMETRPEIKSVDIPRAIFTKMEKPIATDDYLNLYSAVGSQFNWIDRVVMSKEELSQKINAENIDIYKMEINGEAAGYVELIIDHDFVEILYFGLFPEFVGVGIGKLFLQWTIQKAWSYNPKWIQLNTCELDHKTALPNYRKNGFIDYKSTMEERKVVIG